MGAENYYGLCYYYHWFDTSAGGLIVPDDFTCPVASASVLAYKYKFCVIKICCYKIRKLYKTKECISLMQNSHPCVELTIVFVLFFYHKLFIFLNIGFGFFEYLVLEQQ